MDDTALDHRLGRIEDEIKQIAEALRLLTRVDERLKQHRQSLEDHEDRLRALEAVGNKQTGSMATIERVLWIVTSAASLAISIFLR